MGGLKNEEKHTLDTLTNYSFNDSLFRAYRKRHGSEEALKAKEKLTPAMNLITRVGASYIDSLPRSYAQSVMKPANDLLELLEELRNNKFDQDHAESFFGKVDSFNNTHFQKLVEAAVAGSVFSGEIDQLAQTSKTRLQETDKLVEKLKENITDYTIRERSGHFKEESDKAESSASSWLVATGVSLSALLVMGFLSYGYHPPFNITDGITSAISSGSNVLLVQLALSKFLIFGILSYLVVFCSRNYTASKHNATVNRHRQISLMTYQSLADAAKQTDVILGHAASAIYAHQPTGYTNSKHDDGPSAKAFVDLVTKTTNGGDG